jgi:hypothetical protein
MTVRELAVDDQPQPVWRIVVGVLVALLLVAAAAGLALLWIEAPGLYRSSGATPEAQANAVATTRTGIFAALAGVAAVASLIVNARTLIETQRANRNAHQRELEGQVTDRYTKAIAQLGDTRLAIRLGGIYALERIAVDSPRDHRTVVEVLSAYVRTGSRRLWEEDDRPVVPSAPQEAELAADIQAAVTVLGRLPDREEIRRADLRGAFLPGVQLSQANLAGARLSYATLTGADLSRADLLGADLSHADLSHARLMETILVEGARLQGELTDAEYTEALLQPTISISSHPAANLSGANLTGADLATAKVIPTQLSVTRGSESTILPDWIKRPSSWNNNSGSVPKV